MILDRSIDLTLIVPRDHAKEVTRSGLFSNPKQLNIAKINVKHDDISAIDINGRRPFSPPILNFPSALAQPLCSIHDAQHRNFRRHIGAHIFPVTYGFGCGTFDFLFSEVSVGFASFSDSKVVMAKLFK